MIYTVILISSETSQYLSNHEIIFICHDHSPIAQKNWFLQLNKARYTWLNVYDLCVWKKYGQLCIQKCNKQSITKESIVSYLYCKEIQNDQAFLYPLFHKVS